MKAQVRYYAFLSLILSAPLANAEVVSSSDSHFVIRQEATSSMSVDDLWERLIQPRHWWHPDHTYSGKAENLSLDPVAGGLWREVWEGGSVAHGEVIFVKPKTTLRMNAPFGPLQGAGAYTIWTIKVEVVEEGTLVKFEIVASGPPTADLAELASAVNFVKGEAIKRLVD